VVILIIHQYGIRAVKGKGYVAAYSSPAQLRTRQSQKPHAPSAWRVFLPDAAYWQKEKALLDDSLLFQEFDSRKRSACITG